MLTVYNTLLRLVKDFAKLTNADGSFFLICTIFFVFCIFSLFFFMYLLHKGKNYSQFR